MPIEGLQQLLDCPRAFWIAYNIAPDEHLKLGLDDINVPWTVHTRFERVVLAHCDCE